MKLRVAEEAVKDENVWMSLDEVYGTNPVLNGHEKQDEP